MFHWLGSKTISEQKTKPPYAGGSQPLYFASKERDWVFYSFSSTGNSHALETPAGEFRVFPRDKHPYYEADRALAGVSKPWWVIWHQGPPCLAGREQTTPLCAARGAARSAPGPLRQRRPSQPAACPLVSPDSSGNSRPSRPRALWTPHRALRTSPGGLPLPHAGRAYACPGSPAVQSEKAAWQKQPIPSTTRWHVIPGPGEKEISLCTKPRKCHAYKISEVFTYSLQI